MKIPTILALVDSRFRSEARAPQGALDVGEARRVGAVIRRVHRRIPLEIEVEAGAEVGSVAKRLTYRRIISVKGVKPHVAVGAG